MGVGKIIDRVHDKKPVTYLGLDLLRLVLSQADLLMCDGLLASFTLQKAGESISEVNALIKMATTELMVFQISRVFTVCW